MSADLSSRRVLVTGANGFVGAALVRRLTAKAGSVTGVARSSSMTSLGGQTCVQCYEEAGALMAGHACVVHLAARVHVMNDSAQNPLTAFRAANTLLTKKLAWAAAGAGVKRFVFVSSIKVNGEETVLGHPFSAADIPAPQDAYAVSKMEAEQGLREISAKTGMEVVIIRPPLVYGPGVRANFAVLLRAVKRGVPLPLGAIHNQRSLVALDNLLDFIETCLSHPAAAHQTFLVSDGEDLSTPELIRRMAHAAGQPARLVPVPIWLLKAGARVLGKQDRLQRLCGNLQLDIAKNQEVLDWVPPVSVSQGLRLAVMDNLS